MSVLFLSIITNFICIMFVDTYRKEVPIMKKRICGGFIALLFILCTFSVVYADVSQNNENTCTITFKSGSMGNIFNNDNEIVEYVMYENIPENSLWENKITIPVVEPDEGYLFVGWSKENSNEIILNFPTEIVKDETYIANFAPISEQIPAKIAKKTSLLYKIFLFCKNI